MAYQKHRWVHNEIIRAEQLNHIEEGIFNEEQRALQAEELATQSVTNETTRATQAENALGNRVSATENAITTLNGNDQVVGSVDYKIAQATVNMGGYKVVADHTAVVNPSDKYIYLEPDAQATGSDVFTEWVWSDFEIPETFAWYCIGETSLDLSDYIKNTDYASTTTPGIVIVDGTTISIQNGVITANVQGGVTGVKGDNESNYRTGNVNITKANIGLSDVGNFKAVSTVASQGLTSTEQANARDNIGAGTSSFSGSYNDLSNKPGIPTKTSDLTNDSDFVTDASYVHTDENYTSTEKSKLSGIASGAEVNVQANWNESDNTSDAYIQNKPTIPSKTSDLTNDSGFINYKAVSTVANQGLSDTEKANARTNIGAGSSTFSGDYNDLSNKPTLGTAAALNVPASGNASTSQVVKGDDTRLTNSRTPTAHNQASDTITAMTGYSKASSAGAISTSDSLNTAIGKLEKTLDGKGTSNLTIGTTSTTAAAGNHTHSTSIATSSGTNQLTMAANTKYVLTAGGKSYVFTTPPDNNTRDFYIGTSRSGATANVLYFIRS